MLPMFFIYMCHEEVETASGLVMVRRIGEYLSTILSYFRVLPHYCITYLFTSFLFLFLLSACGQQRFLKAEHEPPPDARPGCSLLTLGKSCSIQSIIPLPLRHFIIDISRCGFHVSNFVFDIGKVVLNSKYYSLSLLSCYRSY